MMNAGIARKTWRTLEPIHGMVYFIDEAQERYADLGLQGRSGYFASRAAPMGAVAAEVVMATFFNFRPQLVRDAMNGVWDRVTPAQVLAARLAAVDVALTRAFAPVVAERDGAVALERAAHLAKTAAVAACEQPDGRPLFAGHASLAWPDDAQPHLVLWHAQSLLREFRGDGHIAALTAEGINGPEALVLHHATGELPLAALQGSRAWTDDEWNATVAALADRGYVKSDGSFTDHGRARRQWIEDRTDELAAAPYAALGDDRCEELRTVGRLFSRAVMDAGLLDFTKLLRPAT